MGNWNNPTGPRLGLMLHYTAGNFAGSVAWCKDPASKVSYQAIVSQKGEVALIAPWTARAWHAGRCKSSDPRLPYTDGNSAFEGIALAANPAANPGETVTPEAFAEIVRLCKERFAAHGWPLTETWRIVGHNTECEPRGRKQDPEGPDAAHPVLSVAAVRVAVGCP